MDEREKIREKLDMVLAHLESVKDEEPLAMEAAAWLDDLFGLHVDPDVEFDARDYITGDPVSDAMMLATADVHMDAVSSASFRDIVATAYKAVSAISDVLEIGLKVVDIFPC